MSLTELKGNVVLSSDVGSTTTIGGGGGALNMGNGVTGEIFIGRYTTSNIWIGEASSVSGGDNFVVLGTQDISKTYVRGQFVTINDYGTGQTFINANGGNLTMGTTATLLTTNAVRTIETYAIGGTYNAGSPPTIPTVNRFVGPTTGGSAFSTSFSRYSVNGSSPGTPFLITTTSGVATCQYMEMVVNGIITRSPGAPNIFSTKASFVVHNFNNNDAAGQIVVTGLTYDKQYSSNFNYATFVVFTNSFNQIAITVTINSGNEVRTNWYATLIAYPSMGADGANTNFTITTP